MPTLMQRSVATRNFALRKGDDVSALPEKVRCDLIRAGHAVAYTATDDNPNNLDAARKPGRPRKES